LTALRPMLKQNVFALNAALILCSAAANRHFLALIRFGEVRPAHSGVIAEQRESLRECSPGVRPVAQSASKLAEKALSLVALQ
jgi:hypothetical protein